MDMFSFKCVKHPLVNRESALLQVIEAFQASYVWDEQGFSGVQRPHVSIAPQMYGSGKSTFGQNFQTFVSMNKQFLLHYLDKVGLPGIAKGDNIGKRSLDALLNETLYVVLNLLDVPRGRCFEDTLFEWISREALSQFPNSADLLSQVLSCIGSPEEWFQKLLQVTKKRYLYLFIDEIEALEGDKFAMFKDLTVTRGTSRVHNVYCAFFRVLSKMLLEPFVICIVAGRSDCIISREEDAMPSRITLNFLRLDPFSEATIKYFIQNVTCHNEPIQKVLFPSHPEGHDWFFKQVYDYTGGVPYHVVHALNELGNKCERWNSFRDLSEDEMKVKMERIAPNFSLVVTLSRMTPKSMIVFSSMLLASIFEFRIPKREILFGGLGSYPEYVLEIANHFGFYYVSCSRSEQDEASRIPVEDSDETYFKLVFPKIVLKHIQSRYWNIPPIRFVCSLFSSISRLDSLSISRGSKFEIIFTLILYVRWCFCSKLGELSIFRHSFIEHISIESTKTIGSSKVDPIPNYVPAFSSAVSGIHSANEETYHVTAWKPFFEKYLSKDGIFVPIRQNSNGPDVLIRVTDMKDNSFLAIQGESSSEQTPMETETTKKRVYLIGIALKCFQLSSSGVGRSMIKAEVAKFLHPVASQLELMQNNLRAIQLIVSDKYTEEVSRQFRNNQNWILNSGVYYEDNNNNIVYSCINSEIQPQNIRQEWLCIPPHCQVVVCSTTSLRTFLGCKTSQDLERVFGDNAGWLEQLKPLYDLLSDSFVDLLRRIPFEESVRNSGMMERRNTHPRMDMNVMQVRGEENVASSSMSSSFDWKTFLREYCGFAEAPVIEYYSRQLNLFTPKSFPYLNDTRLSRYGIADQDIPLIIDGIHEFLEKQDKQ
ncbi:hypothetical protein GpartN1_g5160.t1 [Galdieria partita]|uniref:Archaeal ATPase n=1 Tax=Galdieria partita TaxID=83374 RepID=A0A9C7Q052_9RHOD|nr:hypothetical protein GpartN1_g2095.t1 [Galdieria partita]GJQ13369.1 hypothetical protein GpartN1_g5160.t1 [Galdieria partita]